MLLPFLVRYLLIEPSNPQDDTESGNDDDKKYNVD
jgi:hypothetical protein